MDSLTTSIIGGVVLFCTGGGLVALLTYLKDRQAQADTQELSERRIELEALTGHSAQLRQRVDDLEKMHERDRQDLKDYARALEAKERKCQEDYVAAVSRIGFLEGQVDILRGQVCPFPGAHKQNQTTDATPTAGG